jgi:uncharacterized membrane protein YgaE (UPF0421/DUF939 family)
MRERTSVSVILKRSAGHCKQAIKTGVAALLCLYITKLLGLSQGYWAAISSIIVLQSHMGATIKASVGRLMATALGAMVGAIFVALLGSGYLSVAAAITVAALFCIPKRLRDSYRLAGATVVSVMLSTKFTSPWATALERFVEVALGIVVALLIARTMWPSKARQQLREEIQQGFVKLFALFRAVIDRYRLNATLSTEELAARVRGSGRRIHELRQQAIYEPDDEQFPNESIQPTIVHFRMVRQSIEALELSTRDSTNDIFQRNFEPELEQLLSQISLAFEQLTSKLLAPDKSFDSTALTQALEALDQKTSAIATSATSADYRIADVLHFHSFLVSLRSLAVELSLTGQQLINGQSRTTSQFEPISTD